MHAVVAALARRGMEVHRQASETVDFQMPGWGIAMVTATIILFVTLSTSVEYTFGRLIPTLMMVESPQAIVFEPLKSEDPDAPLGESKSEVEPELMIVKQAPITSTFRSAIQHLKAKAGCLARFRGITLFFVYTCNVQYLASCLSVINFIPTGTAPVLAAVICAQLSMAWTHIVISDASPKPWFRRMPSIRTWKKVAGPTAVLAIAEQLSIVLPAWLFVSYGFANMTHDDVLNTPDSARKMLVLKALSVGALALALSLLVVFPANVALTRVQASLLADTEETIIPFDRGFGGKVTPEIVGGSGVIGLLDAWKTFDWNSRVRLLKAYGKVMAMQVCLSILFAMTIGYEVFLIAGDDIQKYISSQGNEVTIDV